jgi:hypothetical protein
MPSSERQTNKKSSSKRLSARLRASDAQIVRMNNPEGPINLFPCSDLCEITIAPDIELRIIKPGSNDDFTKIENPREGKGVIILATVPKGRFIFPDAIRTSEPHLVTLHEVKLPAPPNAVPAGNLPGQSKKPPR